MNMSILRYLKEKYRDISCGYAKKVLDKYDIRERDDIHIRGVLSMGTGKHYEQVTDAFGQTRMIPVLEDVFLQKENMIVIPGNQYVLCKLFNLPITVTGGTVMTPISNVIPGFLNDPSQMNFDSKGIPPTNLVDVNLHPLHYVNGFMVGYGGATQSNLVARAVNYKSRMLYQAVPFRHTAAELNTATRIKYGGIVTSPEPSGGQSVKSYYIKKFDSNPGLQIYHLFKDNGLEDGTPCTNSIFDTMEDNGMDVETYGEIELSIEPLEVREWFQANLSGEPPRISEMGLVAAYWDPGSMDTQHVQLFSHICFPTEPLHGVGSSIGRKAIFCLYRLYLR